MTITGEDDAYHMYSDEWFSERVGSEKHVYPGNDNVVDKYAFIAYGALPGILTK